jgi:hypothetical protein
LSGYHKLEKQFDNREEEDKIAEIEKIDQEPCEMSMEKERKQEENIGVVPTGSH